MSKREYLDSLREFLSYELPERIVQKNIEFYGNYFEEQMRSGKSADQICEELGDPQLIAKSCIDAETAGADGIPNSGDEIDYSEEIARERTKRSFGTGTSAASENRSFDESGKNADPPETKKISGKAGCLIAALLVLGLILLLVAFFSTSFGSAILTVFIGAALIGGVFRLFRRG